MLTGLLMEKKVIPLLPATPEQCKRDMRWSYKQPIDLLLRLKERERKAYFTIMKKAKRSDKEVDKSVISLAAALSSAYHFRRFVECSITEGDGVDLQRLGEIEDIKVEQSRKRPRRPKMERLAHYYSFVRRMSSEGLSLRAMCDMLYKHYGFQVSAPTVSMFLDEHGLTSKGEDYVDHQ